MVRLANRGLNHRGRLLKWMSRSSCVLACNLIITSTSVLAASHQNALQIESGTIALRSGDAGRQLSVTLSLPDGSVLDVTSRCQYAVTPQALAEISPSGYVQPRADGHAIIQVSWREFQAEVDLEISGSRSRRPVSYRNDIVPLLSKAGCNQGACHGNASGKGGFRLSLRGEDPTFDLRSLTREALGRRVDLAAAERSLIVLKPTGQIPHEGGQRFTANSAPASMLREWIASGARDDERSAARLKSLRVLPSDRLVAPADRTSQLVVTAEFDDGSLRDVTRLAAFDLNDPTLAEISSAGLVRVHNPCEVTVAVRFLNGRCTSRLAFLPERPGFVWSGPPAGNIVDSHVFAKLRKLRVNPSEPASDSVFLRRAYLDAIGLLPTAFEVRAFLADCDPQKRSRMIERLLDRPEFADFWALKWADLLRNEEKTMGQKGVWIFQRWLRDQIAADVPLDEMASQIVASQGSNWTSPPSSFHRTNRDPMTAAETVAQVFLGIRLQCARCHNHPFDEWTQDDYYGLAACFSNVARKALNNTRRDRLDKHEINGDEMIYLSGQPGFVQPRTRVSLKPKPPGGAEFPAADDGNALKQLANWLNRNNRQFSRNLANRIWFHLMGRGIVEPVDDFRPSNPPSNSPLLEAITDYLINHGMRLKPLVALIMNSQTYQLGATPNNTNTNDNANFSRATVRLLPAEVLLDAISQVLDVPDAVRGAPRFVRATQLPGVSADNPFLKVFGKPERLLTCECERTDSTTLAQAFQMINGVAVRGKLETSKNRIGKLIEQELNDEAILSELYLAAVGRQPTEAERKAIIARVMCAADRGSGWEDVAWALLNSKEFLLRH
jgi:hypothetical protein